MSDSKEPVPNALKGLLRSSEKAPNAFSGAASGLEAYELAGALEEYSTPKDEHQLLIRRLVEEKRMNLPAIYVDRFHTTYWNGHIRLTMGESGIEASENWRYAVLLEESSVKKLIRRLQNILRYWKEEEEAPAPSEGSDG